MASEKKSGSSGICMKKRIEEISNGRYLIYYSFEDSKIQEQDKASAKEVPPHTTSDREDQR